MELALNLHNGDGSHSDVSPRSVAAVVLHSTQILGGTPRAPASHTADSGPDPRPKPAATIAHPNSCRGNYGPESGLSLST